MSVHPSPLFLGQDFQEN